MNLTPKTIDRAGVLGAIDVSLRNDNDQRVMYMIAIVDGTAKVYTNNRSDLEFVDEYWTYVADIGAAVSVAIEFDGTWTRVKENNVRKWRFYSIGEPWIFRLLASGSLVVRQGLSGSDIILVSDNVTAIATCRGWKNVPTPYNDQGLICAYIRNGYIMYRNYAEQNTVPATWLWESEKDTLVAAVNIGLSRTNDYRTAFVYETSGGEIHWLVTVRRWAGMGVPIENIHVTLDLNIGHNFIYYIVVGDGPFPNASTPPYSSEQHQKTRREYSPEVIAVDFNFQVLLLWAIDTEVSSIENIVTTDSMTGEDVGTGDGVEDTFNLLRNPDSGTLTVYLNGISTTAYTRTGKEIVFNDPVGDTVAITADYQWQNWGKRIKITYAHGIQDLTNAYSAFELADEDSNIYLGLASEAGDDWATPIPPGLFDGTRELILTVQDFNEAAIIPDTTAVMDVAYTPNGPKGEAGQELTTTWTQSFTAINLDPILLPAPEVEELYNE